MIVENKIYVTVKEYSQAAAEGGGEWGGIEGDIKTQGDLQLQFDNLTLLRLTQIEYDALGTKDEDTMYIII
jgi:hypothetical protein